MGRYGLTRRRFVAGSAVGLTALGLGLGASTREAGAATTADVLIVGGGVGGVGAALGALRYFEKFSLSRTVILTEETDWIGGQLTAQAVPPDENPWIEGTGCTETYRNFRNDVRKYYRANYPLRRGPSGYPYLNPGAGNVSALCHEAPVALAVLTAMLRKYVDNGSLVVLLNHRPSGVRVQNGVATSVSFNNSSVTIDVRAGGYALDATELGDLLPWAGVDHVTGAESKAQTGELHALDTADPLDQQAISWCFPLEYIPGENFTIRRPERYTFWRDYKPSFWLGSNLLSWTDINPENVKERRTRYLFDSEPNAQYGDDMWRYRRIFWHVQALTGVYPSDLTLVNWPQMDYWVDPDTGLGDPLVRPNTPGRNESALLKAKELSLSLLYWLQTEAPRKEGGYGYPGLRLRPDLVGTADGLAKAAYIRESRRIQAEFPILEQYIGVKARPGQTSAMTFPDSVGIGYYRIDLHPSTGGTTSPGGRTYVDVPSYRFQIPLGAFIQKPIRVSNLLPAAKNIGTTHITNGCYRLHPVEWNIGEAAGALAAYCVARNVVPDQVRANTATLTDFQDVLIKLGFVLRWPDVLPQEYPDGRPYGGGG